MEGRRHDASTFHRGAAMTRPLDFVPRLTMIVLAASTLLTGVRSADAKLPGCLEGLAPDIVSACEVPAGATLTFNSIKIKNGGTLTFQHGQGATTTLKVGSIVIEDGGTLQADSATNPIGVKGGSLIITFTGKSTDTCETIDATTDFCGKGILVKPGGSLKLYGAKGVSDGGVSWTYLRDAAGPKAGDLGGKDASYITGAKVAGSGTTTLKLAKDVTQGAGAWKSGDWIVVGTTSFSPYESEFVQIDIVTKDSEGTTVTLKSDTPLQFYHFGGPDPGPPSTDNYNGSKSTSDFNYGVDERAEVGLITRSIRLT